MEASPRSSPEQLERARRNYYANRERRKAKVRERRARLKAILTEARSCPCADCGRTYDPVCMDFHHVNGHSDKSFSVTHWERVRRPEGSTMSKEDQLRNEIAKCIVICACCHRLRHKDQMYRRTRA